MATVVVVGEVVVDRFVSADGTHDVAGGSAANTALACHRAGHHTTLRARYSTDPDGAFLRATAQQWGLDLRDAVYTDDPATVVRVDLSGAGTPTYTFRLADTADWQWTDAEIARPLPQGCDAVVVGSLAAVLPPGGQVVRRWATGRHAAGVTVAYDPNARPTALAGFDPEVIRARILEWVRMVDVVKVSDEDLAWIAPDDEPREVASLWSTWGPELVVLTAGASGAWAYRHGDVMAHAVSPHIAVADTVGAGDTLMAWLIGGLMDTPAGVRYSPPSVASTLDRAVRAAAVTCTRRGCQPPTPDEVG